MENAAIVADDTLKPDFDIDPGVEEAEESPEETTSEVKEDSEEKKEANVPEKPKIEFNEEQQRFINEEIIGKKVAKQREAERQAQEERQRREELEAELARLKAPSRPEIPPIPDYFEDNYEQKVRERDEAIRKAVEYDAQQRILSEQREAAAQREQQAQQEIMYGKVQDYSKRADKLGIKPDELQRAGNYVAQYELDDRLIEEILDDDHGPAITVYLANNPMEIEQIRAMRPTKAWAYIESKIKAEAIGSRAKPKPSPEPLDNPKGTGFATQRGPKGAVFE